MTFTRTSHFVLLVAAAVPVSLSAQAPTDDTTASRPSWIGPQVGPLLGIHWDRLQLATLSTGPGVLWCRMREGSAPPFCAGSFVLLSPGWHGGELSVGGMAVSTARLAAVAADVSVLRTWNEPSRAANHATYLGSRLRLVIIPIGVSFGWYRRIAGPAGTHDAIWTLSVGVGMP